MKRKIVLASASPRRRELLKSLPWEIIVCPSEVNEESLVGNNVEETAKIRASAKAQEVSARYVDTIILGADTIVVAPDGETLDKAETLKDAEIMLARLWGTRHRVISAACLIKGDLKIEIIESAWVTLVRPTDQEIEDYIESGESLGKAGGLCVQGEGKKFVRKIEGEEEVVLGLPLKQIVTILERMTEE